VRKKKRGLPKPLDHTLTLMGQDIKMLDRVLKTKDCLCSEFEDHWIEGCREGLAIAVDLFEGRIQDVAVRSTFQGRPIRVRYFAGAEKTITDASLLAPDGVPY